MGRLDIDMQRKYPYHSRVMSKVEQLDGVKKVELLYFKGSEGKLAL